MMFNSHRERSRDRAKTLAQSLRDQLCWMGAGLLLGCLALAFISSWNNMDWAGDTLMKLEAQALLRQSQRADGTPKSNDAYMSLYQSWAAVPEPVRSQFGPEPTRDGKVLEAVIKHAGEEAFLYLLPFQTEDGERRFLLSRHNRADIETLGEEFFSAALIHSLLTTLVVFGLLFALFFWLIRRATQPIALLSAWAQTLGTRTRVDAPNFEIEELNQLAQRMQEGVARIEAFNAREKQFLKHASHEMRTPLAIIQASLDTLELQTGEAGKASLRRAQLAGANMALLSSALLWLARESPQALKKERVSLDAFFQAIIEDHRYLLTARDVEVRLELSPDIVKIEKSLLHIVLANLVRNAFQHSSGGVIVMTTDRDGLRMTNPINPEDADSNVEGFGLGLELVRRICDKLNWRFSVDLTGEGAQVSVIWLPTPAS
ncbi:Signal transduction histidine kinase [Hahella chejuensis KCTC 2396]|uniref:histidine kinase n=1 Tax=Hahella chejuensis (strain KCTC 2396) TaxID=349521 RepID=Q2SE84_HAHCH|nr:HAMP domain-containing sensor histidine kinase [Hahella chejuensis]ABC31040.1 Signal transduction histidine kinase [Hahella chejuensis KCTC 2396]